MSGTNNVFVYPQFLFADNLDGARYYQDTDDENVEYANKMALNDEFAIALMDLSWLEAFNEIWTEDNLDKLKTLTMVQVIHECKNFLDQSVYNPIRSQPIGDGQTNALIACNMPGTFAELIGKIYVADHYSEEDMARLTELAEGLITTFRELLDETSWLSDSSKEKMTMKLDNLRLNLLIPDGGYHDYSDLVLTRSEDGGTLLGNYLTLKAYHNEKENELLGQSALSDMNWRYYGPSFANASYEAKENCINLFPGFISSGYMYHTDMSDEEMYGKVGWVIAHEMSHGFDYKNSQMDAYGLGNSIFEGDDLDDYLGKVDQVVSYFNTLEPFPGIFENGMLVRGEASADMIGIQLLPEKAKGESDFDHEAFFRSCAEEYERILPPAYSRQPIFWKK